MKTLGRNADNDLYLEAGGLAILHDADAQCAVIEAILQTQQGELQFDPDRGIDYFGTVLQNPTYIDFWAAQVQSRIEDLDFVDSVDDFTYRFDNKTSTLYWSMTVTNKDDDKLDLRDKKTVIDGSPGTDISWNDIYDKPTGVQEALDMVEAMHEEAVDTKEKLKSSSTLRDTKDLLNRIVFDPNDEEYAKTRKITFTFDGVPLGTVIDVSNIRLDVKNTGSDGAYYAPFIVEIDDGLKLRADQTISMAATGNQIIFLDSERGQDEEGHAYTTQKHTLMKGGTVTITIKGNITKIWCADESKPIFLTSKGAVFPYLSGITVGERVPLSEIGNGVFSGFGNLQKVVWNEGTESSIVFGDYVFSGCSSIMDVTWLPKRTTSLGVGCFKDCKSLMSLKGMGETLISQIPDYCFFGCSQLKNCGHLPEGITSIGSHVFYGCTLLKNIDELPQSVGSLGEECFCGCTGITAILYPPESLQTIGKRCFADCTSLESLYIGESTTEIGEEAFAGCTKLNNIMSDAGTTAAAPSVDATSFNGELPIVYVPVALLSAYRSHSVWGAMTLYKYGVYKFGLKDIEAGTTLLSSTSNLVSDSIWSITYGVGDKPQRFIPSVESLPSFTYNAAADEAMITIKGYVRSLSATSSESYPFFATSAASQFPNLESVKIEDSPLEWIGDYAFAQCINLSSIDCGFEEERDYCLGERAFWKCSSLTDTGWLKAGLGRLIKEVETTYEEQPDGTMTPIYTPILYPAFGERCFWQSGITALEYDPADVKELPAYCFAETGISSIHGLGNSVLTAIGDHCFYNCDGLNDITDLPNTGLTTLPDYCFAECGLLRSIEGIENLVSNGMGSHVFENSGVRSLSPIEDAAGITEIAPYMFNGCALETLYGLTAKIVGLGERCFANNSSLTDISELTKTSVTELPVGCFQNGVMQSLIGCWKITSIGDFAFARCSSLIATSGLGPDIASIGDYAFQNCTGLKQVSCIATSVPTIASTAFSGSSASNIPLYVREDMVDEFSAADTWRNFSRTTSRTIKIHLQNVGGDESEDKNISSVYADSTGVKISIDPDADTNLGMWYVDYGDDTPLEHHEAKGLSLYNAVEQHDFKKLGTDENGEEKLIKTRGNYTITLFGDITEIWGEHTDDIVDGSYPHLEPENMGASPFLGELSGRASSIIISSEYLQKIGDLCFFNYGQAQGEGNDNSLSVSITMNGEGIVGGYAFAKKDYTHGPLGTLGAFNAVMLGDYAFYKSGLDSSAPFNTVVTTGTASFAYNPLITDLSGLSGLAKVTKNLFEGCTGITTTSGLSSVTEIKEDGFKGCAGLTTVKDFNDSFSLIEDGAFSGCPNITSIFMANIEPPTLREYGFDGSDGVFLQDAIVYVPAGFEKTYEETPYWTKFAGRIISRSIEFTLENVTAGSRTRDGMGIVTATGNWVLSYGNGEQSFQFHAGETAIPAYTFKGYGQKIVKISGPVTSIRCTSSAYPIFGQSVGYNPWLTKVVSSDAMDITDIGDYLFRGCSSLQSITKADTIVSVGEYSFADARSLTDITGLSNVNTIGQYAFSGCASLPNLYGMNNVTTIGERAFNGCSSLKTIDGLGTGVTSIGDYAFASCGNLQEVQMFAEEPPTIYENTFSGIDAEKVFLYVRSRHINSYVRNAAWSSVFKTIRSRYVEFNLTACPSRVNIDPEHGVVKSNTFWVADWDSSSWDGVVCNSEMETLLPSHQYQLSGNHTIRLEGAITGIFAKNDTDIVPEYTENEGGVRTAVSSIPSNGSFITLSVGGSETDSDNVSYVSKLLTKVERSEYAVLENIGDAAFISNKALSATLLSGIKTIGKASFAYCTSITNTELLQSVQTIGECAFYGCTGITDLTNLNGLLEGSTSDPSIDDFAFGGITNLASVQCGVTHPPAFDPTAMPFGYFEPKEEGSDKTKQEDVTLYVQLSSVSEYESANIWKLFTVASQVVKFVMENIPSGTTIIGLSGNNSVGAGRVEIQSSGNWYMDWGDGTPQDVMTHNNTSFPAHTYEYDERSPIAGEWVSQTVGGTTTWFLKSVTIQLTGDIKTIACQTVTNKPFLAIDGIEGNPYLTTVEASESLSNLTVIGDYAFQNCTALTKVVGFTNVVSIGQYAFQGCASLADLGDESNCFQRVTAIGNGAFSGCASLTSLRAFPKALKLGIRAFADCVGMIETTGLGADYVGVPYYTMYNETFTIGSDFPLTITPGKSTYTISEMKEDSLVEVTEGWYTIRQVTIDGEGKIIDVAWTNNIDLTATFGSYAFENCTFSSINMESFEAPPIIQNTTFTVDPTKTLVYVPAATQYVNPTEKYKDAPGWMLFFGNIISASSLSLEFYPGTIRGNTDAPKVETTGSSVVDSTGIAVYGMGIVTFTNEIFSIDWGDGSATQEIAGTDTGVTTESDEKIFSAAFPNHIYPATFQPSETKSVTIRLRGLITGIKGVSTGDGNYNPLFALANVEKVYGRDEEGNWRLNSATIDTSSLRYDALREVTIGGDAKISTIGEGCFYGFTDTSSGTEDERLGLKTIVIQQSASGSASAINEIGTKAFYNCSCLQSVSNPGGMSGENPPPSVGDYAFYGCSTLQDDRVQGTWALDFLTGCSTIGEGAFKGCNNIKLLSRDEGSGNIIGLNAVTSIGRSAFKDCTGLVKISLPSTLTSVCESAFEGCNKITQGIEWGDANEMSATGKIGRRAFYGCTAADNNNWDVVIPSQIATIGESAFFKCGMQNFTWNGTGTGTLDGLTTTGAAGTFEGCDNLQTVTIAKSIGAIPARAFCMDVNLRTVSMDGSRTSIGDYAFFGCNTLGTGYDNDSFANICNGLEAPIGAYAFARCMNLGEIEIPENVPALGEGCFSCSSLGFYKGEWDENITYTDTEPPTFKTLLQFEEGMTKEYGGRRMDVWGEYDKILTRNTEEETPLPLTISWPYSGATPPTRTVGKGCFMNSRTLSLDWSGFQSVTLVPDYCFFNCQKLFQGANLSVLPSGITYFGRFSLARTGMVEIGRSKIDENTGEPITGSPISANLSPALFLGCSNLKTLGDVKGEGASQFVDGLAGLFSTIPSAIPDGCFYGCSALEDINTLAADLPSVKRIGQYSFAYCKKLKGRGTYNISNALAEITQIDDGCFMGCSGIAGVFQGIPKVSYYPYLSFYGCTSISEISQFYDASISEDEEVTLEGESFGGIVSLDKINLSYSTMVGIVGANGSSDPFSGIPYNDDGKRDAEIVVPNGLLSAYTSDSYWNEFYIQTSFDGLTPCMVITMSVPSIGGTIRGFGRIEIDTSESDLLAFSWGDGTANVYTEEIVGGVLDLSSVAHTYNFGLSEGDMDQNITLAIYGNVTSVSGAADNKTSSVITNKTVVPFLYTAVTAMQSDPPVPIRAKNTWFRSVTFSTSTITKIGDGAFGYCTEMAAPSIPLQVTELGNNAFFGCDKVTSLDMIPVGSAISKIGQYCFAYCDYLTDYSGFARLTTLEAVPNGCFAKTSSVIPGTEQKLDWLPASVKSIGFAAFQHVCFSYFDLQTSTPITVGNYAFRYNNSLKDFTDGNGNAGILLNLTGTNVFRDCKALETLEGLTLAPANTAIPTGTFRGCSALSDISDIPSQINAIGDASFYGTAVSNLSQIPSSISTIGSDTFPPYDETFVNDLGGAFEGCGSLTSLAGMPTSITKIGTAAFKNCPLGDLTGMSSNVTRLGPYCFYGCTLMEDLDGLSTGVSALPEGGFGNCPGLTSILIPSAVTTIGKKCFAGSSNLNRITLLNTSVTNLEDNPISDASENCFPYSTLNDVGSSLQVVVPSSAKAGYVELWAASGRFNSNRIVEA